MGDQAVLKISMAFTWNSYEKSYKWKNHYPVYNVTEEYKWYNTTERSITEKNKEKRNVGLLSLLEALQWYQ